MEKFKKLFGDNEYWFEIDFREAEDFLSYLSEWGCKWQNGDEIDCENDCIAYTHYAISPKGLVRNVTEIEWTLSGHDVRKRNFKKFCEIIYRYNRDCMDAYENIENWLGDGTNDKKIIRIEKEEERERTFANDICNKYSCRQGKEIWFEVSFELGSEFLGRLNKLGFKWKNGELIKPEEGIACIRIAVMKNEKLIYYITEEKWQDSRLKIIEKFSYEKWLKEGKYVPAGNYEFPDLRKGMFSGYSPQYKEYLKRIEKAEKYL